jgi:hypothetical protein
MQRVTPSSLHLDAYMATSLRTRKRSRQWRARVDGQRGNVWRLAIVHFSNGPQSRAGGSGQTQRLARLAAVVRVAATNGTGAVRAVRRQERSLSSVPSRPSGDTKCELVVPSGGC